MTADRRPSFAELVEWIEGRLAPDDAASIADLLARGDAETTAAVRWLGRFHATTRALPMEQPPPLVRQHLRQRFARWATTGALRSTPQELATTLVFDSRRDLDLVGLRAGDGSDRTVQLAYAAPGADLVVDARSLPVRGRLDLEGQVFLDERPPNAPAFEATARGEGWSARTVDGDALGRFRIGPVPAGKIDLRVTNGEIVLTAQLDLTEVPP